jgi:hypothetical protein
VTSDGRFSPEAVRAFAEGIAAHPGDAPEYIADPHVERLLRLIVHGMYRPDTGQANRRKRRRERKAWVLAFERIAELRAAQAAEERALYRARYDAIRM